MSRWKAFILTQSNRLEVVEFETPNIVREDAIAQCMSMYGAKEVKSCNPISESASEGFYKKGESYSSSSSNGGDYDFASTLIMIGIVFGIILVVQFWPIFLIGGITYLAYWLYKKLK
jgi:hypothetical protein